MSLSCSDFQQDVLNRLIALGFLKTEAIEDCGDDIGALIDLVNDKLSEVNGHLVARDEKLKATYHVVVGVDPSHTTSFWNGKAWNYCPAHHPLKEGENAPMLLDTDEACRVRDAAKTHNPNTRFHILNVKVQA